MKSSNKIIKKTNELCIVSLSSSPWEHPYWVSRQFLMYELSKFCPILYATGREYIKNVVTLSFLKKKYLPQSPPFFPPDNLHIQTSPLITSKNYKYKKIDNMLANYYGRLLRKNCRKMSNGKIVAYVWEPEYIELLDGLEPDIVVYHPYDKFEAMAKKKEEKIRVKKLEEKIVEIADIIITPSKRIAESLNHGNVHIVHNAVFTPALTMADAEKSTLFQHIPHPRIGYIGMISQKIDFRLIFEIAQKKDNFSFILMGPENLSNRKDCQKGLESLKKLKNFYLYPPVKFDRVFEYMKQFDVGIMPYSLSGHDAYCESPLKMYQYRLCGLPVITSALPNIADRPGILSCASTVSEWINQMENALENNSDELKKKRIALAMENSWQQRAQTIFSLLLKSI